MKRLVRAIFAMAALAPLPAWSQSLHGCSDLDGQHSLASVEGTNGVFYAIDPELRLFHPFSDGTIEALATLTEALASQGTTLIYVPLPTRSLAMPEFLPSKARDLGFDPAIGSTLYIDLLNRLSRGGVLAVDARLPLRAPAGEPLSFFRTDPRLTAAGGRRLAQAVSQAIQATSTYGNLPKSRFESQAGGIVVLPSKMRSTLQRHCLMTLPEVETETFTTIRVSPGTATSDTAIFGTPGGSARIAVVGTEVSGDAVANLPGFLSEQSGLDVQHYAVEGGGSFAAISAYLTSREFQELRPAYLVWVNPIENSLADQGDQPLTELVAAAGGTCQVGLPAGRGSDGNILIADLTGVSPAQSVALFLDADGASAREARFDFTGPDAQVRSRSIIRHPDQLATGRFYMPMSGLWPEGARTVSVTLDVSFGPNARMTACAG